MKVCGSSPFFWNHPQHPQLNGDSMWWFGWMGYIRWYFRNRKGSHKINNTTKSPILVFSVIAKYPFSRMKSMCLMFFRGSVPTFACSKTPQTCLVYHPPKLTQTLRITGFDYKVVFQVRKEIGGSSC